MKEPYDIASKKGIAAIGFNAKDVSYKLGFKVQVREKFARVKLFMDLLIGNSPGIWDRR